MVEELSSTYQSTKEFCLSKHLEINPAKTQFIIFKNQSKKIDDDVALKVDTLTIIPQPQVKLLGMVLDKHLTLKDHISSLVNTCNGYLGVLRRMSHLWPRKLSLLFYTAIIRSQLEYASALLVPVASSHLEKLNIIQRKAARIICNVPSDSHSEPLLKELDLCSLHDRRVKRTVKLVMDSLNNNCHPGLSNKFLEDEEGDDGGNLRLPSTKTAMGRKRFSYFGADLFNNSH